MREIRHAESIKPLPNPLRNRAKKTNVAKSLELVILSTVSHSAKLAEVSKTNPKFIEAFKPMKFSAYSMNLNETNMPHVYPASITPTSKLLKDTNLV